MYLKIIILIRLEVCGRIKMIDDFDTVECVEEDEEILEDYVLMAIICGDW